MPEDSMERRPHLMRILRGLFRHLEDLVEADPWLPVPQAGCCFAFGAEKRPLPIGALDLLLRGDWLMRDACPLCSGWLMRFTFGAFGDGGGVKACCLGCGRIYYHFIGGLAAVTKTLAWRLRDTPFAISGAYDNAALCGSRLPLWNALRDLGVRSLPDIHWTEARPELELWYVLDPPPGPGSDVPKDTWIHLFDGSPAERSGMGRLLRLPAEGRNHE